MAFKSDFGGLAFKCSDIKIFTQASSWATKLSQLHRQPGTVRIITYSLPDLKYIKKVLSKRPENIFIIANSKFINKANEIKNEFLNINIALHPEVHSKILTIEPNIIYFSSANFGDSTWHESSLGFHSKEAHDWYVKNEFELLWSKCKIVQKEDSDEK